MVVQQLDASARPRRIALPTPVLAGAARPRVQPVRIQIGAQLRNSLEEIARDDLVNRGDALRPSLRLLVAA
jgi:hypothetical protein